MRLQRLPTIANEQSKNEGAQAKRSTTAVKMFILNLRWRMEERQCLAAIVSEQRMIGNNGRSSCEKRQIECRDYH